ncbi:hypothetical protein M378DRAFT_36994, partial [Amanita muscaria Koide BX008]
MSGKTLSTSTLSLRFMRNAQRAKQLKEVELEKAAVHDDAQWDVGQEVREAWGLVSEQDPFQTVTHETSYLPFLFSDTSDAVTESNPASKIPKGRRTFNFGAPEDSIEDKEPEPLPQTQQQSEPPLSKDKKRRSRLHPNPVPIQSVSEKLIEGLPVLKKSKPARDAIFDNSGVGTDLRAPSSAKSKTAVSETSTSLGFLKPSGVDAPPEKSRIKRSDLTDGAREKKPKRSREGEGMDTSEPKEKKRPKQK